MIYRCQLERWRIVTVCSCTTFGSHRTITVKLLWLEAKNMNTVQLWWPFKVTLRALIIDWLKLIVCCRILIQNECSGTMSCISQDFLYWQFKGQKTDWGFVNTAWFNLFVELLQQLLQYFHCAQWSMDVYNSLVEYVVSSPDPPFSAALDVLGMRLQWTMHWYISWEL